MTPALAASALLVALSACSGGDGSGVPTAPSPTLSPSPTAATAAPSPTPVVIDADTIIDLAASPPAATYVGSDAGDFRSDLPPLVSGDFNGDGIADILLGARFGDGPTDDRQDAGEAYVIFGSRGPLSGVDIGAAEQDLTFWGAEPDDNLGFAAAAADVNDDGTDDIILGAPFASAAGVTAASAGAVYVIFGRDDLAGSLDLALKSADVTISGPGGSSFFGDSIATGDVNGDGIDDVMVGATFARAADSDSGSPGATYVFFGASDWPSSRDTAGGDYDAAIFGADHLDELGDTVVSGDINDDGIDDIIMTAEAADGPDNARPTAAEVHVVFGSGDLSGDLLIADGDQDLSVLGADDRDTLGFSLASGDVNGDGVDDMIFSARGDNGPMNSRNRVGAVYILLGGRNLPRSIDLAADLQGVVGFYGMDAADIMAYPFVGDVNGDGGVELLIGSGAADGPDNGRSDAGEVYVLDSASVDALDGLETVGTGKLVAAIFGAREGDGLGTALTVADINGDGLPELVILAVGADGPDGESVDAGEVVIISLAEG